MSSESARVGEKGRREGEERKVCRKGIRLREIPAIILFLIYM